MLTGMQKPPFYEFGLSRPSQLRFIWLRFGLASAMMFTVACGHSRLSSQLIAKSMMKLAGVSGISGLSRMNLGPKRWPQGLVASAYWTDTSLSSIEIWNYRPAGFFGIDILSLKIWLNLFRILKDKYRLWDEKNNCVFTIFFNFTL